MDSPRHWRASAALASQEGLHPLDWPGLCARLLAARHLDRAAAQTRRAGSFDPAVAGVMAAAAEGVPAVNLAVSESGKAGADMTADARQPHSD